MPGREVEITLADVNERLSALEAIWRDSASGGTASLRARNIDIDKLDELTNDLGLITQGQIEIGASLQRRITYSSIEEALSAYDDINRIFWKVSYVDTEHWRLGLPGTPSIIYANDAVSADGHIIDPYSLPITALICDPAMAEFLENGSLSADNLAINVALGFIRLGTDARGAFGNDDGWRIRNTSLSLPPDEMAGLRWDAIQSSGGDTPQVDTVVSYLAGRYALNFRAEEPTVGAPSVPTFVLGSLEKALAHWGYDGSWWSSTYGALSVNLAVPEEQTTGEAYMLLEAHDAQTLQEYGSILIAEDGMTLSASKISVPNMLSFRLETPGVYPEGGLYYNWTSHRWQFFNGTALRYLSDAAA